MVLKTLKKVFLRYRGITLLWLSYVLPAFLTYGKVHFLLPGLFQWLMVRPFTVPWLPLFLMSLAQDVLLSCPLGIHGLFLGCFSLIVLNQHSFIYKRSFSLKWVFLGVLVALFQAVLFWVLVLSKNHHHLIWFFVYQWVIPVAFFPIFSHFLSPWMIERPRKIHGA